MRETHKVWLPHSAGFELMLPKGYSIKRVGQQAGDLVAWVDADWSNPSEPIEFRAEPQSAKPPAGGVVVDHFVGLTGNRWTLYRVPAAPSAEAVVGPLAAIYRDDEAPTSFDGVTVGEWVDVPPPGDAEPDPPPPGLVVGPVDVVYQTNRDVAQGVLEEIPRGPFELVLDGSSDSTEPAD